MIQRLLNDSQSFITTAFVALIAVLVSTYAMAFDEVNKTSSGVAIKGYDTVAYHSENRAVKGKSEFSYNWNGAVWYFATAKNRNLFAADPKRYAPQYGGY